MGHFLMRTPKSSGFIIIFLTKRSTIAQKHSRKSTWIFCRSLPSNTMRNIFLNGMKDNVTPSGFDGVSAVFYNNASPSGLGMEAVWFPRVELPLVTQAIQDG